MSNGLWIMNRINKSTIQPDVLAAFTRSVGHGSIRNANPVVRELEPEEASRLDLHVTPGTSRRTGDDHRSVVLCRSIVAAEAGLIERIARGLDVAMRIVTVKARDR